MNDQITKITLKEAQEYYDSAQEELYRPEEDLLPYKVCRSSYKSVGNFLAAFLFHNGITVKNEMTLKFLLNSCIEINERFKELDLDPLYYGNAHQDEVVYADRETMDIYLNRAEQARDLVTELIG